MPEPITTPVYDTYWRWIAERQAMYERRLVDPIGPWTQDPVLAGHRFTNVFRVSDRVSQRLVRDVQYGQGRSQAIDEVFYRTIVFKTWNREDVWDHLEEILGPISWQATPPSEICRVLDAMHAAGRRIYSAAYIMPAPPYGHVRKHANHCALIETMMADGLPLTEFLGGRKNRDSLYTKLLSKSETIAAQIYDKLRFRVVTRTNDDVLPVLNFLARKLFPFSYLIPSESKNTLVDLSAVARAHPTFASHLRDPMAHRRDDGLAELVDNRFSAKSYRVIHFVVDLPVRIPDAVLASAPASAQNLGPVVFVLTEFQLVDQSSEISNTLGDASHDRYKERQRLAVRDRLRLGVQPAKRGGRGQSVPPKTRTRGG